MHGRWLLAGFLSLTTAAGLAACSSNALMKPDCHSCTVEEQGWKDFAWKDLVGRWKGSVETTRNQLGAKKTRQEQAAEFRFYRADAFLQAHGSACPALPAEALVLNGQLWDAGAKSRDYDAFIPTEDNRVAYGRVSFEKVNGQELCHFRHFGRVMGKNRLDLPAVSFSGDALPGRALASKSVAQDISVEFLRFASAEPATQQFDPSGRKPSSVGQQERPSLMFRVFRVTSQIKGSRSEWSGTEEQIYRLWKAE